MGTDAEVFIFDYETYIVEVVPSFVDTFRTGRVATWLQPFVKERQLDPELWDRTELARFISALNPDLSWQGPYDLESVYYFDWRKRWSTFKRNSDLDEAPSENLAEQINWLFKIGVSLKCLDAGQFIGRSYTVSHYVETLSDLGVKEDDRVVSLLAALGKRGFLIGYQFGAGFEGINGWLDAAETAELAHRLELLPLPDYQVFFAGMNGLRMPEREYEFSGFSFAEVSLSFVRTTAIMAVSENRGLLWGNGLMPAEFYGDGYPFIEKRKS
jgi:hypothetical protein